MSALFVVIAPVFLLIAMGRITVLMRWMDAPGLRGLNDFIFYAAVPALLFRSIATASEISVVGASSIYFVACAIVYALAMLLARLLLGSGLAQAAVIGLNASFGNAVMMGIPVIVTAFGQGALNSLLGIILVHTVILLPVATILIEAGSARHTGAGAILRATLRGMARNPVLLSIAAAFVWRAAVYSIPGWALPAWIDRFLSLLGGAMSPVALFCLGAALPALSESRLVLREAFMATGLKLLLLPALVWGLSHAAGLSGLPLQVAVLTAGMPTGANAFLLARRMHTMMEAAASTVVVATALSLVTLSVLLAWLQ